jgi:autoinducer 2-degrading protein
MIATIVHVWVKKEYLEDFIRETEKNHNQSIKEKGNLRFDVLQDMDNPSKFTLYEAYNSVESATAHKSTPHYLEWREKVADWMEKPRESVKHSILLPKPV